MGQQTVDGILYSHVNAHALKRGDLVTIPSGEDSWRVVRTHRFTDRRGAVKVRVTFAVRGFGESDGLLGINEPVLRAVGARP